VCIKLSVIATLNCAFLFIRHVN